MRALNDYEGAVILISHDRHLIEACADRLWIVRDGTVRTYDGDMDRYRAECLAERGASRRRRAPRQRRTARASPRRRRRAGRRPSSAPRWRPLKKQVTKAEAEIERLSLQIATIDAALADSGLYARNPARAQALARERGELTRAARARRGGLARRQRGLRGGGKRSPSHGLE